MAETKKFCVHSNGYGWCKCLSDDESCEYCVEGPCPHEEIAEYAPVVHGRWLLEAHNERVNYRWNVTAECSECCDEKREIWAGFFPNVPDSIAKEAALISAESVKLSNYCPNCGAKMDLDVADINVGNKGGAADGEV